MSSNTQYLPHAISLLLAMVGIESAQAGSGEIDSRAFGGNSQIVFMETFECDNGIYGLVIKKEDWYGGISGEGSVLLDSKIVRAAWELEGPPEHESEFIRKIYHDEEFSKIQYESPQYMKLLKGAQKKDAEHREKVLEALSAEHKRAGLKLDAETEQIIYFFSGKAKMRVIESLQGDLIQGDEIDVTWKHVQRRTTCPPIIPFKGKCGWIFDSKVQDGSKTGLGHGFFSLEAGKKAKTEHQRGEQGADPNRVAE